jgi:hypothetical protein
MLQGSPSHAVWDLGALYGRQLRRRWGHLALSAGLAVTGGTGSVLVQNTPFGFCPPTPDCVLPEDDLPPSREDRPFTTVGVPFELEAGLSVLDDLGIGLTVFGNLNGYATTAALSLAILIGDL